MPRLRTPNGINQRSGRDIEAAALERWRAVYTPALAGLIDLEQLLAAGDIDVNVAAREAVSALRALVDARDQLMRLEAIMLGAVVLRGDASIGEIVARTGIAGSTLRRRLHPGPIEMRGRECLPDGGSPWGWRPL